MRLERTLPLSCAFVLLPLASERVAAQAYPPEIREAQVRVYRSVDGVDLKMWILMPQDHDC